MKARTETERQLGGERTQEHEETARVPPRRALLSSAVARQQAGRLILGSFGPYFLHLYNRSSRRSRRSGRRKSVRRRHMETQSSARVLPARICARYRKKKKKVCVCI